MKFEGKQKRKSIECKFRLFLEASWFMPRCDWSVDDVNSAQIYFWFIRRPSSFLKVQKKVKNIKRKSFLLKVIVFDDKDFPWLVRVFLFLSYEVFAWKSRWIEVNCKQDDPRENRKNLFQNKFSFTRRSDDKK